jgi:hypothetical protein
MANYKPGFEREGPPTEKESFAIIEVPSKADAIDWTKRFLSRRRR